MRFQRGNESVLRFDRNSWGDLGSLSEYRLGRCRGWGCGAGTVRARGVHPNVRLTTLAQRFTRAVKCGKWSWGKELTLLVRKGVELFMSIEIEMELGSPSSIFGNGKGTMI